jgi:uncharacterized protein YkwD
MAREHVAFGRKITLVGRSDLDPIGDVEDPQAEPPPERPALVGLVVGLGERHFRIVRPQIVGAPIVRSGPDVPSVQSARYPRYVRRFPLTVVSVALISGVVVAATLAQAANGPIMSAALPGETASRLQVSNQPSTDAERMGRLLVEQINAERAAYGLAPYQFDTAIAAAAAAHSADQAAHRKMSHAGTDGSNAGQRLTRQGVTWSSWGENVGAGFDDPATLTQAWLDSPTHRPIVLHATYARVGAGVATASDGTRYWTMDVVG